MLLTKIFIAYGKPPHSISETSNSVAFKFGMSLTEALKQR